MFQKPKGTLDILPEETALWQSMEETIRKACENAGFNEIRIPTFELAGVYKRGVGATTDIVQKEMFTLYDKGDNVEMCLRPEGTAGVVRSVVENGLFNEALPLKLYYIGPFFRYEKPQAGRSREFYQFGTELFGAQSASADASIIALAADVLEKIGIDSELNINSIGCKECRPKYRKALCDYFESRKDELCDSCKERLKTNPLRILDCKSKVCKAVAENAPKTVDFLCEDCKTHFETLKTGLNLMNIKYTVNPKIVRGLDYYVRTVFEFVSDDIGAQSTVCGGGRYDGLVSELGGPDLCGIGFGMGLTRLVLALKAKEREGKISLPKAKAPKIYIASMGERAAQFALGMTEVLRKKGIYAECDLCERSLKAQMKYADKTGAKYVLVIGDNELDKGSAELKNMADKEDRRIIKLDEISDIIERI
jgi:histidyl-tRNA synthetase